VESITAAGNTEIPAYLVLTGLGYVIAPDQGGEDESWTARKGDLLLRASGLLELLGLHHMRAARGEEWHAGDAETDAFLAKYYPEN
jgi:hypothetical protein